jgi:hypothetical protein
VSLKFFVRALSKHLLSIRSHLSLILQHVFTVAAKLNAIFVFSFALLFVYLLLASVLN